MRKILDLLLPQTCAGCGAPGGVWCPGCAATLDDVRVVERSATRGLAPVLALTAYGGAVRRAVIAYKERNRWPLARPLGLALAAALPRLAALVPAAAAAWPALVTLLGAEVGDAEPGHGRGVLWLVPAPSTAASIRRRGGNHMARVAGIAAAALGARGVRAGVAPALAYGRGTRDSVGLDRELRAANARRHLAVDRAALPPSGSPVLVTDDVITTGSTAAACVRALRAEGHPVLAVLACAATD
ncbi:ComF family protein [Actinokineospora inagensis]|uniref:ComF family protein n=1 Tax=Actinokineospora inagensis TaxID=103730 RepID=UPI00040B3F9E|nr:ComF family protein [Actinokineospora inagensis]